MLPASSNCHNAARPHSPTDISPNRHTRPYSDGNTGLDRHPGSDCYPDACSYIYSQPNTCADTRASNSGRDFRQDITIVGIY